MPQDAKKGTSATSRPLHHQLMRFVLVGAIATGAHYITALLCSTQVSVYSSNLAGYLVAVAISYFGHQRFSFEVAADDVSHGRQFPRFVAGSLGGLALSYLLLFVMDHLLGTSTWLSLAVAVGLVPLYAFIVNKFWVFQTRD